MDYYEGVVINYLRADRSLFVNTECCIQVNPGHNPDKTGPHWYCDAVAADFRSKTIYLCEISYSDTLQALIQRLTDWNSNWGAVRAALVRDNALPGDWYVRPWLFVPEAKGCAKKLIAALLKLDSNGQRLAFKPKITPLEMVQPWNYCTYDRNGESPKPDLIPAEMQV